jgi:hypothetical protein
MAEKRSRNSYAREYGFRNEYDMRNWSNQHREAIDKGKPHVMDDVGRFNPQQAAEYYYQIGMYEDMQPDDMDDETLGRARHFALKYYMDWLDMDFDDAYSAMQEIYGDSGEESAS